MNNINFIQTSRINSSSNWQFLVQIEQKAEVTKKEEKVTIINLSGDLCFVKNCCSCVIVVESNYSVYSLAKIIYVLVAINFLLLYVFIHFSRLLCKMRKCLTICAYCLLLVTYCLETLLVGSHMNSVEQKRFDY